jgi:Putative adhesin
MNRRTASIVASASVCAVAAVVVPTACAVLGAQYHLTVSYDVSQPITTVVIDDGAGNVQVTGGASALSVSELQSYRNAAPTSSHAVVDGTLTLAFHCSSNGCGIDYDVKVPDGVAVRIDAGAGDVTLSELDGSIQATADAGKITASGLTARQARFTDSAGDILVGFATPPVSLYADSSAGDVTLLVPGSANYQVAASSQAGAVHVTVPQSAGSANTITAKSAAGDVAVRTQQV